MKLTIIVEFPEKMSDFAKHDLQVAIQEMKETMAYIGGKVTKAELAK